jgi:hypothetical protein
MAGTTNEHGSTQIVVLRVILLVGAAFSREPDQDQSSRAFAAESRSYSDDFVSLNLC